jgi:large subunit ribosomal protein L10
MARPEKVAVVTEVRARLEESTAALLTEYRGLTVSELSQLRGELRKSEAEYRIAKNTLVRLAARDAGLDIPDDLLTGPTAVTFCAGDPVAVAKVLRKFSREHPELVIKGGVLDGKVLDAGETQRLADLESREELLARFAGVMQALVAQPAQLALASLSKVARLLAAYQQKREEGGEVAEPAAADAQAQGAPSPPAEQQAGVVDDTPAPDSPAAEAVTEEAAATPGVDATPAAGAADAPAADQPEPDLRADPAPPASP